MLMLMLLPLSCLPCRRLVPGRGDSRAAAPARPRSLPCPAAYDLASGGKPVYNTYLVGRKLRDGGLVWAVNVSSMGERARGVGPRPALGGSSRGAGGG